MNPTRLAWLAAALVACCSSLAPAEIVTLKDGRRLEGLIVKQDAEAIELDMGTVQSRWPMSEIESIEPGLPVTVFRQRMTRALQAAEQQARSGNTAGATRTLQNAISQFESDLARLESFPPEVQALLDRAENLRRSMIPKSPESQKAEELFQLAKKDLDFAKEVDAFRKLREAIALDPARADIQHVLGSVATRVNEPQAAIEAFGAAIRLSPEAYYSKSAGQLLTLLEDRGRRLLADRRAPDALPIFEEILLLKGTTGTVALEEFVARRIAREQKAPEEVLIEVYKYADDNDLVDLAFAAVSKAATLKPDDPVISGLLKEETFLKDFRKAIGEGNLELAAALQADPLASLPRIADRVREAAGTASLDIQAAGVVASARKALEADKYTEAEALARRVITEFPGTPSMSEATEIIRVAQLEAPIREGLSKAAAQTDARRYDNAEATLAKLEADYDISQSRQQASYAAAVKRIPREREADRMWELARIEIERERFDEALARLNELVSTYPETFAGKQATEWLSDYRRRLEGEAKRTRLFDVGATFAIADPALWRAADDSRPRTTGIVDPVAAAYRTPAWKQFDSLMERQEELSRDRRAGWLHVGLPLLAGGIALFGLVWRFAKPGSGQYKEIDQIEEEVREASHSAVDVATHSLHTCRMCGQKNPLDALICGACGAPTQLSEVEQERADDRDRRANYDPWSVRVQAKAVNHFEKYYQQARDLAETSDAQAAIELCRQALHEDPLRKDGYLLLASLYERVGRNDEAATCYREVLLIDPGEVIVRQKIESLLSLSEQPLHFARIAAVVSALLWWSVFWIVAGADLYWWWARLPLCIIGGLLTWQLWRIRQRTNKTTVEALNQAIVERPRGLPTSTLSWRGQDRQAAELARTIEAHTGIPVPVLGTWRLVVAILISLVALALLVTLAWVNASPWALLAWPALVALAFYLLEIHPRALTAYVLLRHVYEETTSPWMDPHRPFKPNRLQVLGEFLLQSYNEFPIRWALKPTPYPDNRQGILNSLQQTLNRHWACHQFYGGLRVVRDIEMPMPPGIKSATAGLILLLVVGGVAAGVHAAERARVERRFTDSMRLGYQNLLDGQALLARGYFLEALQTAPNRAVAPLYMAHSMNALQRDAEAERAFRLATALAPGESIPHNDYGNFLQRQGRLRDAVAQYEMALVSDPTNGDILSNLGSAYYKLKEHEKAVDALERAVKATPDHSRAHTSLGLALEALGRWPDAEKAFREAIRVAPDVPYTDVARTRLEEGPRKPGDKLEIPAASAPRSAP